MIHFSPILTFCLDECSDNRNLFDYLIWLNGFGSLPKLESARSHRPDIRL
jgi:hypothetical protein